ncbi:MAG: YkgJ family cysteine cluster protein [Myxococcales bacterium]|nr:YkgJ family cysteine cluster protein [Myxococcales bacterium]MBK7191717.1 YkgJ family cysteine cluster protein [Myxococcales bacterium]MBP6843109.1 YkgJ family cysteine cluster protein [Kofleriaceae bacterium]
MSKRTRPKPRPEPVLGPEHGPTFAEVVERMALVAKASGLTRELIADINTAAAEHARVTLSVVSCYTCDAPKACCSLLTSAYLYEVVPIAARLIREGRDTPELRAQLKQRAHAMETTPKKDYKLPCLFLGDGELCTIYEDRPSVCGSHLVTSPASHCSDHATVMITKLSHPSQTTIPPQVDEVFRQEAGLRPLGESYRGALPRMVLLCLEAWHRRDYATFLAERVLPASHRFEWAVK